MAAYLIYHLFGKVSPPITTLRPAYPDFKAENPTQTVTSFGGLVFMILCAAYIGVVIVIEAGPVYAIFMAEINRQALSILKWVWITVSFSMHRQKKADFLSSNQYHH